MFADILYCDLRLRRTGILNVDLQLFVPTKINSQTFHSTGDTFFALILIHFAVGSTLLKQYRLDFVFIFTDSSGFSNFSMNHVIILGVVASILDSTKQMDDQDSLTQRS